MHEQKNQRAWLWFILAGGVVIAAQRLLATPMWQFSLYIGLDLLALGAMGFGLRRNRPHPHAPWRWLIASQVVCLIADATIYTMNDVFHVVKWPGPADLFYIARYAFVFTALLGLVRSRSGGRPDRAAALDAGVAATAAALLAWLLWVGPSLSYSMPLLNRGVVAVYPVADIAIFAISIRLLGGQGSRPMAFWLLNSAFLLMLGGDALLGWQQSRGTYVIHNFDDAVWLGSLVLLTAACLHPSVGAVGAPVRHTQPRLTARAVALVLAAAVPPACLLWRGASDRSDAIAIAAASVLMYSLVVLRLHLALREQAQARQEIETKERRLAETVALLEAATEARSRLLDGIVTAGEKERTWIAAELHDGPIQSLSAIGFGLDRARRRLAKDETAAAADALDSQRAGLTDVITRLRNLMSELRPPALDHGGLDSAIRDYAAGFSRDCAITCEVTVSCGTARLGQKSETIVYRVAQEALNNVRKHSRATHCEVSVKTYEGQVVLEVRDNGEGFDTALAHRFVQEHHFGLSTMRERVEVAGGTWRLQSAPGEGTVIRACIPASAEVKVSEVA